MSSTSTAPLILPLSRGRQLVFEQPPLVMGIINVTPDSFSDGGVHYERGVAVESALRMEGEGAAVIDVGGESTRPGAEPVEAEEELARVIPVIEEIRRRSDIPISIDTSKAVVAEAAMAAGADMVNDVTALRGDPAIAAVVKSRGTPVILMHMRGEPRTMQQSVHYHDLMGEIESELRGFVASAVATGIDRSEILIDPGIGFGKTFDHNLEILARCRELVGIAPLVIGASRKAFIGKLTGRPGGRARMAGSLGAVAAAAAGGASMVRVHDVPESVDFLRVFRAIGGAAR